MGFVEAVGSWGEVTDTVRLARSDRSVRVCSGVAVLTPWLEAPRPSSKTISDSRAEAEVEVIFSVGASASEGPVATGSGSATFWGPEVNHQPAMLAIARIRMAKIQRLRRDRRRLLM